MSIVAILLHLAPKIHPEYLDVFKKRQLILDQYGINTPKRIAHFLSQMHHESAGFRALKEYRSYASAERKYGHTTRVGKILGNVYPGDGGKYLGRGIIQLTGRYNYKHYGKKIGVDLISNPDLASEATNALKIACVYWHAKGLNRLADVDDINKITKRINGGFNGLKDRKYLLARYKNAVGQFGI